MGMFPFLSSPAAYKAQADKYVHRFLYITYSGENTFGGFEEI